MGRLSKTKIVNFESGLSLISVLETKEPYCISFYTPKKRHTIDLAIHYGRGLPTLRDGNADIGQGISGYFKLDIPMKRIFYAPSGNSFQWRDSHVAKAAGNNYFFDGDFSDVLSELNEKGYRFFQITPLSDRRITKGRETDYENDLYRKKRLVVENAMEQFEKTTGMDKAEAFQAEGVRTLEEIMKGWHLTPMTVKIDAQDYISRIKVGWPSLEF